MPMDVIRVKALLRQSAVAWKRTLRTADYKSERSIDIYTNHRLLVTRENSQWRGVVACGEITNM